MGSVAQQRGGGAERWVALSNTFLPFVEGGQYFFKILLLGWTTVCFMLGRRGATSRG